MVEEIVAGPATRLFHALAVRGADTGGHLIPCWAEQRTVAQLRERGGRGKSARGLNLQWDMVRMAILRGHCIGRLQCLKSCKKDQAPLPSPATHVLAV